jgi:hypothetical protein
MMLLVLNLSPAIAKSFSDCTTSKFAILISGLFCLERFIASSKLFGILTIEFEVFLRDFGLSIFPIIFS